MNYREHKHLKAERASLLSMLERMPGDAMIDRLSIQARLKGIDAELATLASSPRMPASARITFRGRPVIASHGVFAKFGADAMHAFSETVTTLAASFGKSLANMGPLPNREQHQLLITGTAVGSFGFEVEERQSELPLADAHPAAFDEDSTVALALGKTVELLQSVVGTDDELTEAITAVDKRAIKELRDLLDLLAKNEAVCNLEFRDRSVGFRDVAQVRRSLERLAEDNIHEEQQLFYGEFQGVLPKRRTFEFKVAADGCIINGKIAAEIEDPDILNQYLHIPIPISVTATRLGEGRPRYTLRQMPDWSNSPKSEGFIYASR